MLHYIEVKQPWSPITTSMGDRLGALGADSMGSDFAAGER